MKLKLEDDIILDVKFWSFVKCSALASLAMTGITYLIIIIIFVAFILLGGTLPPIQ